MRALVILARVAGVLVLLAVLAFAGVVLRGYHLVRSVHRAPPTTFAAARDSASVERGQHLARIVCVNCHSADNDLPLSGGRSNMIALPDGPVFGMLVASNLTPGGVLRAYRDGELARAIREGVGRDGRALLVMPSANLRRLSDHDLAALIGFLRSQPAVAGDPPARRIDLLGYVALGAGVFPLSDQRPITAPVPDVPEGADARYGGYLVHLAGCPDCHGRDLQGAAPGQFAPHGPDLVGFAQAHPLETFDRALRGGMSPSGRGLDPTLMPWTTYAGFSPLEVEALYRYLGSRPPLAKR